jgi:hypothetical protein
MMAFKGTIRDRRPQVCEGKSKAIGKSVSYVITCEHA